jgi:hypothetical protein
VDLSNKLKKVIEITEVIEISTTQIIDFGTLKLSAK